MYLTKGQIWRVWIWMIFKRWKFNYFCYRVDSGFRIDIAFKESKKIKKSGWRKAQKWVDTL